MLITPAGTSEASSTVYNSVAARGCASDGIAITVLPTATAGPTSDTNPNRGSASGQAMPITPMGSFMASVAQIATRHPRDPLREFVGTLRQVLGEIVQDLAAIVAARLRPTVRGVRRLDRIADVLAVPLRDLGEQRP